MVIAGVGAWVLAAAFGFACAAWPEYIKPHPYLIISFGMAGLLMLAIPVVQRFFPIFKEENHLPLELQMQIDDVYMRRAGNGQPFFSVGELFLLVRAELVAPMSADVSYTLEIVQQGMTVTTEWVGDIEGWVRAAKINDSTRAGDAIVMYDMDGLPTHYERGEKRDAWLHFKIPPMPESSLRHCVLRLLAQSRHGSSSYDKAAGSWPILRNDFKIVKKPNR